MPTKSGIMLGLGETMEQVQATLRDLRAHDVDMVTIGQYLQPSAHHHPVLRYWTPEEFKALEVYGMALGFSHVASGPLVRSSYHADRQAAEAGVAGLNRPVAPSAHARDRMVRSHPAALRRRLEWMSSVRCNFQHCHPVHAGRQTPPIPSSGRTAARVNRMKLSRTLPSP